MATITIPNNITKQDELIAVPRKIYEELIEFKKAMAPTYKPTKAELQALERSRKNFKEGKFIEWTKLRNELDRNHRRSGRKTA